MTFYNCIKCGKRAIKAKFLKEGEEVPNGPVGTSKGMICADCNV